ncbi:glycosyl hydrolase family 76 [Bacteroidales bacterium 6E]|nr:glycosyl hydrolase family 76 [Bacteroidales bacterium 6E]
MIKIATFIVPFLWCCLSIAHGNVHGPFVDGEIIGSPLYKTNFVRAMEITDHTMAAHFTGPNMAMARYFNPYTGTKSVETGSIWMYTSAIEAVNAIMHSLKLIKDNGDDQLYKEHFNRYAVLLEELYTHADYYLGTFELTSYTQTRKWTVYGVHRGHAPGTAKVEGVENVYDDQMWLIRELLESYKITGNSDYLVKAEYLTEYVLDGWDCTLDQDGEEMGGITWGPGYVTKHSCSNGPMVSPLVWLHEIYKHSEDQLTYRFIDANDKVTRTARQVKKSQYYLDFAQKIYAWQKKNLLRTDGVYDDMMGGCTPRRPEIEFINDTPYRKGIFCRDRVGPAITYNSGTMISGTADLYRVTGQSQYLDDAVRLSDASFQYFANLGKEKPGYYSYDISGFRNWFNGVLMRGYTEIYPIYRGVSNYIESFQRNLDHGYDHYLHDGFLPSNLLQGWNEDENSNNIEAMFSFAYAAEYAVLARHEFERMK